MAPAWNVSSSGRLLLVGRIHRFVRSFVRLSVRVYVLLIIFCPDGRCFDNYAIVAASTEYSLTLRALESHKFPFLPIKKRTLTATTTNFWAI